MLRTIAVWIYTRLVIDIVSYTPTKMGDLLRRLYIKLISKKCGKNFVAHTGVQFFSPWRLSVGHNVSISRFTIINASAELVLKDNIMMGPNCNIMTLNHGFSDITRPMNQQESVSHKLVINEDVWLGNGVVINSGSREVHIAKGVIIASNSVVTQTLDKEYGIYGGVPAKFIKYRYE